ncbi:MAG: PKD domain-containing protein [Muribaculaceae bacterium]
MKIFNKIAVAALAMFSLAACSENYVDPGYYPSADVDFTYNVDGDQYTLDYYVVSTIQFNNTSAKTGNFVWDFGDGTTSTEANPTHKYDVAGNYKVTLTLEGVGSRTYPLMINDIAPLLTVATQSDDIIEFNKTTMTFNIELPNPENLPVRYVWTFPEGTTYADGTPATEFIGYSDDQGNIEYPAPVMFKNIGSQRVSIVTTFDTRDGGENRRLADSYLNVQVGVNEPAATLYYAQRGGNIKAIKLVDNVPAGTKVMPYDLGVPTGSTVFNILCNSTFTAGSEEEGIPDQETDWIYILDAGKQYYYVNDENGVLGDGTMTAMHADGSGVNVVITNVGGPAFNDPFRGYINNGIIYYSDRNTGFTAIDCTTRGAVEGVGDSNRRASYVMTNENTPFKDQGISWGAITNGLLRDSNNWWWIGKNYNGYGIFRFRDSDVYATEAEAKKHPLPSQAILSGEKTTAFTIDEKNNALYVYHSGANQGFRAYTIPDYSATVTTSDAYFSKTLDCTPENTTAEEGLYVTQLALDNETGKVYFCYRPEANDDSGLKAGIVVFDPATQTLKNYGETSDLATGCVINPRKTKLF